MWKLLNLLILLVEDCFFYYFLVTGKLSEWIILKASNVIVWLLDFSSRNFDDPKIISKSKIIDIS